MAKKPKIIEPIGNGENFEDFLSKVLGTEIENKKTDNIKNTDENK